MFHFLFLYFLVPDDLVLQLLQNRLAQLDAVTKGWVIHGFPKTREQAESLTKAGYEPNRYTSLNTFAQSYNRRYSGHIAVCRIKWMLFLYHASIIATVSYLDLKLTMKAATNSIASQLTKLTIKNGAFLKRDMASFL